MCRCGIGRWEGRRNVASLLLSCCHSYMVSPFSCLGNVQEMKVTAEVLPSSPKLLPGEVGEWVTGSCTNLLPYNKSVFIQGSGIACWGEKGRPPAGNTYSVPRLQLCKLWAYLIHQLGKVRVRQKLQSSSSSPSDSHGSAAGLVTGKIFLLYWGLIWLSSFPWNSPCLSLSLMLGLELGCPALCLMAESPSMEMEGW